MWQYYFNLAYTYIGPFFKSDDLIPFRCGVRFLATKTIDCIISIFIDQIIWFLSEWVLSDHILRSSAALIISY